MTLKYPRLASMLVASLIAFAPASPSIAMDDAERAEIETVIREYLLANPGLLLDMQRELETQQRETQALASAQALERNKDRLINSEFAITIGDAEAPITVVEFFDYNCGFCKRSLELFERTAEAHPDVKFVFREFPILSEDSLDAHKVSLALAQTRPELYADFHVELMSGSGRATGEKARQIALGLGMAESELDTALESASIDDAIRETYQIAEAMGINGTPGFVIGDEVVPGAISLDDLESRYENLRNCGSTRCS
jgi:protein-disulfide isomerase